MLNPYLIGGAVLAVALAGGIGYAKGHERASLECEAALAEALEETTEALTSLIAENEAQAAEARADAIRINDLLDNETEVANLKAANFQDRIDEIRTEALIDADCPAPRYVGLNQLLVDAASGSATNIITGDTPASTKRTSQTLPQ